MTGNSWRKIALRVFAGAFCILIVGLPISFLCPARVKPINLSDQSVQFRFAVITRGTNHVIFIGNPVLARLKWGLYESRFGPLYQWVPKKIKSDWVVTHTDVNERVLWVGFEGPQPHFLRASITNSVGHNVELPFVSSFQSSSGLRAGPLNLHAFELPGTLDRFKVHTVRIYSLGMFEKENALALLQLP